MEHRTIVAVVLFFFLCGSADGGNKELARDKSKSIDLFDLVSVFLIPASMQTTVPGWQTGAEPGSPIRWETDGIEWVDTRKAHIRTGEAIVTISGEPIHVLRKYWEPNPWRITAIGPRAGIFRVEISSQINSQELQLDMEGEMKKRQIHYRIYKCDPTGAASSGERLYSIQVPGKQPAWLDHEWSCGSGGCSAFLSVLLFKEDADALPGLVPSCGGGK